jgi:hypothetical protein
VSTEPTTADTIREHLTTIIAARLVEPEWREATP